MTGPLPRGLGAFVGRSLVRLDAARAAKMRAGGLRHALLMTSAVDGFVMSRRELIEAAQALREQDIDPWVWSFPDHTKRAALQCADELLECALLIKAAGIVGNLEKTGKGPNGRPLAPAARWAGDFVEVLAAGAQASRIGLGIVSYPQPIKWGMPLDAMSNPYAFGMPEVYKTALSRKEVDAAIAEWRTRFSAVVPVVPCFDVSDLSARQQMNATLDNACLDKSSKLKVAACSTWVDAAFDAQERAVCADFAKRVGWA